jgi:hypothetical protein
MFSATLLHPMNKLLLVLSMIIFGAPIWAQSSLDGSRLVKSAKGTFYVSVDDTVKIFINGKEVYYVGKAGNSRSPEMELRTGDRVVVHLVEQGGGKQFMLVFASSDGTTVVSFRHRDMKIVPDLGVTDFSVDKFNQWKKYAQEFKRKDALPVKGRSEWVWGDLDSCILASLITPEMFGPRK